MLNIVLLEPEIPHNTGAIARTCAATGARLHLIEPLGFDISDKMVKRCGLDYWHLVDISVYRCLDEYFEKNGDEGLWLATTKAPRDYSEADFTADSVSIMLGKGVGGSVGLAVVLLAAGGQRQGHDEGEDEGKCSFHVVGSP